jgi:hypothetical protein
MLKPNEVYFAAQEAFARNDLKEYQRLVNLYHKMLVN